MENKDNEVLLHRISACSNKHDPCPEILVYSNDVIINDDFGGTVKMRPDQMQRLVRRYMEQVGESS